MIAATNWWWSRGSGDVYCVDHRQTHVPFGAAARRLLSDCIASTRRDGIAEFINLQRAGVSGKVYQVRQVRAILLRCELGKRADTVNGADSDRET